VYKAVYVPITHDEKSASVYYPTFSVWQIMMYPDCWPSNHILNSLAIKLSEHVFGIEPWSVRLPNILAFIFFSGVMYLVAVRYFDHSFFLFCLPFAVMFCNPFLLDFFGLARGYGMSNALMAGSVYCLLRYVSRWRARWYFFTIIFAMLAAYANFTLLIYWVAVNIWLLILLIAGNTGNKEALSKTLYLMLFTLLLAAAFLALCYQPLYKMQSTNQFVYWSKTSFFSNTIMDQASNFIYNNNESRAIPVLSYGVVIVFCITAAVTIWKTISLKTAALTDPLVVLFMVLLLVWLVNMIQTKLLGTPYLTTRTALSYYVLFAFLLMFLVRDIGLQVRWAGVSLAFVTVVLFLFHLAQAATVSCVREWWFDANTYQVLDYLQGYRKAHPEIKTLDLNTTWIFNPSFGFYCISGKEPWLKLTEIHTTTDTASQTKFYYAMRDELPQLKQYTPVLSFDNGSRVLLIKK